MKGAYPVWRAGIGALLSLLTVAAPGVRASRSACAFCPPECPMHAPQASAGATRGTPMKCHGTARDRAAPVGPATVVSRPPCGAHGAIAGFATAPAVLPDRPCGWVLPCRATRPDPREHYAGRGVEPPDTPPPIHRG